MDAKKVLIIKKIKKYINELKKNGFNIEKVYLYGSYAKGNYHKDSDIDIVIISKDFQGIRFYDWKRIVPFRRKIDVRIEPMPYRPEDFNEGDPLAVEIMANGEEVKI
jgi:hypothetical protein